MKTCIGCGFEKEVEAFDNWSRSKSGNRARCKECRHGDYIKQQDRFKKAARDNRIGEGATDHFEAQKIEQNNACAICGQESPACLDHNHSTGQWRGALCQRCNSGLGDFMEDPKLLISAIDYLLKWQVKP
jgi:hypothetical protein